jgi:hypothetical protein
MVNQATAHSARAAVGHVRRAGRGEFSNQDVPRSKQNCLDGLGCC